MHMYARDDTQAYIYIHKTGIPYILIFLHVIVCDE